MPTNLVAAIDDYLRSRNLSRGTRDEYGVTMRKWTEWGKDVPIEQMGRKDIREFLDWVHERAIAIDGSNPGRTSNKARENLRAVLAWAWEQDLIDVLPRFPQPKQQRSVAGRHYLTKAELNALYFATYSLPQPRGWVQQFSVGQYWRCALVVFFNYGVDTGTIWKSTNWHEPILWQHITWDRLSPSGQGKQRSRWGWISYRRVKTGKLFFRPMNRVVHEHMKSIKPENPQPDEPVFYGGSSRPNVQFKQLCEFANIKPKRDIESGANQPWLLKDLRKTCATYYDQHLPESSIEILGHSVAGVTYRHYAHRDPLAFKAITTIPQPSAFLSLLKGMDGECPCCRRKF